MADKTVCAFGSNYGIIYSDLGDSHALTFSTAVPGAAHPSNDVASSMLGNYPIRLVNKGTGFAIATAAPTVPMPANDVAASILGISYPIRLVNLGDGYAIATKQLVYGSARGSGDIDVPLFGNLSIRLVNNGDNTYSLGVATATVPAPSQDAVMSLFGISWPVRLVNIGTGYAIAAVGAGYAGKVLSQSSSILALWPLSEASGATAFDISGNGRNGAYVASPALGQVGIGDGATAVLLNASTQYINVFSGSLQSAFNGPAGTLMVWFKVRAASVWTDATNRTLANFQVDANNLVQLSKTSTNNTLFWDYAAGGTAKLTTVTYSALTWTQMAITWDKTADAVKFYLNGAQQGATVNGLGVWAGSIASTTSVLGSVNTTPGQLWDGYLAYGALWSVALTAAQISTLNTVP